MGGAGGYNSTVMAFTTGAQGPTDGSLQFELRVEHPVYKEARPEVRDDQVHGVHTLKAHSAYCEWGLIPPCTYTCTHTGLHTPPRM